MEKLWLSKAVHTTNITRDEAAEWLDYLSAYTNEFIVKNFNWYVKKGYWPLKAQKKDAGEKDPKFCVVHHTSNAVGNYKPALNRFFSAKKASSNFLIGKEADELFYLISIHNQSYHAVKRSWIPISVRRALNIENGWLNEVGTEVAGNGGKTPPFSYEQFLNVICLHRYLAAFFPSIKELKSHRFFSKISRAGDPGPLFLLPLVEHAVFNDVCLTDSGYWLSQYKKDKIEFLKRSNEVIESMNLKDKDEWFKTREKIIKSLRG